MQQIRLGFGIAMTGEARGEAKGAHRHDMTTATTWCILLWRVRVRLPALQLKLLIVDTVVAVAWLGLAWLGLAILCVITGNMC